MSYGNGYPNGTYSTNRYEDAPLEDRPPTSSRDRRNGGYGGFHDDTLTVPGQPDFEPPPPHPSFRRRYTDDSPGGFGLFASGRRDTDDYDTSRSRERGGRGQGAHRSQGTGPGGRQIEDVLDHIHSQWDVLTRDDCVPVHVALQLMDYSSLGRGNDYQDFQRTNRHLQKALKAIVNEHHQGFNSSIGTFHKIQASILASQSRVRMLRDSMQGAKSNLMITKPELKSLGTSSQNYDEMISIIGQIEKLQLVPDQLDARISDKHFLPAVDLLQDALRIIRKSEMEDLGALTDLRIYFSNQETSLTDILVEELHDHLYLKSPYCNDRWKRNNGDSSDTSSSENGSKTLPNTLGRPIYRFLNDLDTSLPLEDDASRNPETDSFYYIYMIIESLNKLGHLDVVVDRIDQRLPVELFAIVDRTNQEVDVRHSAHVRNPQNPEQNKMTADLESNSVSEEVLNDLLWTLYAKFEAIAEGHRAVHEVIAGIVRREGMRQSENLLGGFKELWKLYQSEVCRHLNGYRAQADFVRCDHSCMTTLHQMKTNQGDQDAKPL